MLRYKTKLSYFTGLAQPIIWDDNNYILMKSNKNVSNVVHAIYP